MPQHRSEVSPTPVDSAAEKRITRRLFVRAGLASAASFALPGLGNARSSNSPKQSSEQTIRLSDYLDGSGAAGSADRNNKALRALLAEVSNSRKPVVITANKGAVFRISGGELRSFEGVGRLQMDGAAFQWSGDLGQSDAPLLSFGSGWAVEGMEFCVRNGSDFRRLIDFRGGNHRLAHNHVWAESQIDNGGALLNFGIRIFGDRNRVEGLRVENIDKALLAYGGNGAPGKDNRFDGVEVVSFVTGFELRNLSDCRNIGFSSRNRSPNAREDPGNNALLHSGVSNYVLRDFAIRDAGEHGCRFGGTRNAEEASRHITVSHGTIRRSGQSGMKFFTGRKGQRFVDVNVSDVRVVDCQYEPQRRKELPGFNDEGFLIQQVVRGTFSGLSVLREDNPTGFSCDCVLYISGADQVIVDGLRGSRPRRNFVRISQWDDGAGKRPVEALPNNGIAIRNAGGTEIGEDGVYIDHPSMPISNLALSASIDGAGRRGYFGVKVNSRPDLIRGPCVIDCDARGFRGGEVDAPAGARELTVTARKRKS